jgi:hypothetical protein
MCVNCSKPRQRGAAAREPQPECTWDDVKEVSSTKVRKKNEGSEEVGQDTAAAKKAKIAELEDRVGKCPSRSIDQGKLTIFS